MNGKQVNWILSGLAFIVLTLALGKNVHAEKGNLKLGKALYKEECVICHNVEGKGNGPAAPFMDPKPRDFTRGVYKVRSTLILVTDDDIFNTITNGMPGTLMPSFKDLTEDERWSLVTYVKNFSEAFETEIPEPILIPAAPPQTEEHLEDGEVLYVDAGCLACHGEYGKGDGPSANTLKDEWGDPIRAYDFTVPGMMKGGSTVEDVYRILCVGMGGTPMPSYLDAMTEEMIWSLSYFVLSLSEEVTSELPPGDPSIGRSLFTGGTRFENGGSSCIACHSVTGIGTLGGGNMGPDLTRTYTKFDEYGINLITKSFPFPVMNPIFNEHSLTLQEQTHLAAFFKQVMDKQPTQAIGLITILIIIVTVILIVLTNLIWRRRLVAVRRPLVEQSALSHYIKTNGGIYDGLDSRLG